MTVFIDANVIVYAGSDVKEAEPCLEILEAIGRGDLAGRTSTAALEEVWHFERSGTGGSGFSGVTRTSYELFTPLLEIGDETFVAALDLPATRLGTNDRLHAATCLVNRIETIVSADSGFDELADLERVDPLDDDARRKLLAAGSG